MSKSIQILKQFLFLILLCPLISQGQPVFKEKLGDDLWLNFNSEVYFSGHSALLVGANFQRSSFSGDRLGNSPFDETQFSLGYEQFIREKWQLRLLQNRIRTVSGRKDITVGGIQHNGRIKSLIFLKSFDVAFIQQKDNTNNDFRFSLRGYIGKRFPVKKINTQLGFRYEIFRNWNDIGEPRRISKTRLWLEYQLLFTKNIVGRLFILRDTNYFFAEEQFGLDDDGDLVLVKPYRKLNLFTPTYGIGLRYIIQPQNAHPKMPFNLFQAK